GRYRAPAPSALTKLFAFCADRRPYAPRDPPGPTDRESNHWLPNGVNEVICSEPWRWPSPSGNGKPGRTWDHRPWRVLLADTRCRPPTSIILTHHPPYPFARSIADPAGYGAVRPAYHGPRFPCSPGAGGSGPKTPITLEFIQQVLTKALSEIGYEAPQDVVKKLIARVTLVSSRASSRATSPMKTNKNKNKRQASSSSDEGATCSDSTVVGSDSESENSNTSFTLVEGGDRQTAPRTGAKPTAPPRPKLPPPIFLRKGANFSKYPQTAPTLRLSAVSTISRGLQSPFHTYALEEERKLKAVIRGIPTDFPVDEIQADLCGLPVHSVHRLCRRDGSPLWLVLAVLPRTEEAKNIFNNLNMVCGLLGYPSRGPAQEKRSRAVPPLPVVRPRGRQLSCGPALREMFGPTLDQRVPAYS
ncbi:hypothetical protein EVAR_46112_1, partial [Eumeta japonica]